MKFIIGLLLFGLRSHAAGLNNGSISSIAPAYHSVNFTGRWVLPDAQTNSYEIDVYVEDFSTPSFLERILNKIRSFKQTAVDLLIPAEIGNEISTVYVSVKNTIVSIINELAAVLSSPFPTEHNFEVPLDVEYQLVTQEQAHDLGGDQFQERQEEQHQENHDNFSAQDSTCYSVCSYEATKNKRRKSQSRKRKSWLSRLRTFLVWVICGIPSNTSIHTQPVYYVSGFEAPTTCEPKVIAGAQGMFASIDAWLQCGESHGNVCRVSEMYWHMGIEEEFPEPFEEGTAEEFECWTLESDKQVSSVTSLDLLSGQDSDSVSSIEAVNGTGTIDSDFQRNERKLIVDREVYKLDQMFSTFRLPRGEEMNEVYMGVGGYLRYYERMKTHADTFEWIAAYCSGIANAIVEECGSDYGSGRLHLLARKINKIGETGRFSLSKYQELRRKLAYADRHLSLKQLENPDTLAYHLEVRKNPALAALANIIGKALVKQLEALMEKRDTLLQTYRFTLKELITEYHMCFGVKTPLFSKS